METTRIIEEYLEGSLSAEERAWVEENAEKSRDFKELIKLHKEINESIKDRKFAEFHRLLQKVSAGYRNENTAKHLVGSAKSKFNLVLKIAALFILICGSAALIRFFVFQSDNPDKLFGRYYESYQSDVIARTGVSEYPDIEKAIIYYNNEEYQMAYSSLNSIITAEPENYLAWFYKGLTCLELNKSAEAVSSFETTPDEWNSLLNEHRDWYLALSYLKDNRREKAVILFRKISELRGYYAEKAAKINHRLSE